jgi:hypothetical protein
VVVELAKVAKLQSFEHDVTLKRARRRVQR